MLITHGVAPPHKEKNKNNQKQHSHPKYLLSLTFRSRAGLCQEPPGDGTENQHGEAPGTGTYKKEILRRKKQS